VSEQFCKDHPKIKMQVGVCNRCDGDGYTESDLEDMGDPLLWHNAGTCYQCKGTGHGFLECHVCEEDFRMEQEMENDL